MLYSIALAVHIASGSSALITGFLAIVFKKGSTKHKRAGLIYFYSMIFVCVSALTISLMKLEFFLLHIGLFSVYMVFSGYRAIQEKTFRAQWYDWTLLIISLVNAGFMVASLNVILMVFGGIGLVLNLGDFRFFVMKIRNLEIPKIQWLVRHIGMMLGAYISTFTAFLVVNITEVEYPVVVWLLPTVIGSPLIAFWTRKTLISVKSRSQVD